MGYQLGIDLGTTYTAAAVSRSTDRGWVEPEVVSLGSRSATVASVLFIAPDGSVLVGEAAERRALTDPDRVVREFKRRIGDPTPIVVAGRNWAPEELSARLVRWVVDRVAEREGGPADRIALTHPAAWGSHKRDLLARALAGQGLSVTFLAEPQAAALHYATAERVGTGSTIAVYDLGGGTFDAAVVRKGDASAAGSGPAGFGLLGRPEGLERLGGIDFDDVVFEHVRAGMPEAFEGLDDTDPAVLSAVALLRRDCREAKEALSSDTEVSIPVLLPAARGSVRLHRSEFEQLIRQQVEDTVEALRRAVVSAGLTAEQLTAVLLVGGSSRIPLVAQLVSEQLGRPVAVDADPKNAIAKGAALALAPMPTASWPSGAIPPVQAGSGGGPGGGHGGGPGPSGWAARGAGAAAAGAAAGAAAMSAGGPPGAPVRPPLPGSGSSMPGHSPPRTFPSGVDRAAPLSARSGGPPSAPPRSTPARAPDPPVRSAGPVHESATSLFTGGAQDRPEQSWAPPPERGWERDEPPDWDDDDRGPTRRPFGLYVGAAGLAAVALIVVVLLYWPDSSPGLGVNTGNSTESSAVQTTDEDAPATTGRGVAPSTAKQDPDDATTSEQTEESRTSERSTAEEPTTTTPPPKPSTPVVEPPPPAPDVSTQGQGVPGDVAPPASAVVGPAAGG